MAYTVNGGKSSIITNLDATPPVRATAGQGADTRLMMKEGTITPGASAATTNYFPIIRVPTYAIIKRLEVVLDAAATTLTGSLGLIFSDANDGTSANYQSSTNTPSIVSQSFFAYQLAMATFCYVVGTDPSNTIGISAPVDVTFANSGGNSVTDGYYVPSSSTLPLWQALSTGPGKATSGTSPSAFVSCATDPGGFFDVTLFITTTGSAANVKTTCRVWYTEGAGQ